jgi:hypothetical protein
MLKQYWNDPVWSKVIAGIILAVGTIMGTYFLDWWPSIGGLAKATYSFATSQTVLSIWVIGVLGLLAAPTVIIILILIWHAIFPTSSRDIEDWRSYKTDMFFGLRWRWRYFEDGQPYETHTFCPHCDFQVYPTNASAFRSVDRIAFHCDSCGQNLGAFDEPLELLENKVKRFIQQKIRNGRWATEASPNLK